MSGQNKPIAAAPSRLSRLAVRPRSSAAPRTSELGDHDAVEGKGIAMAQVVDKRVTAEIEGIRRLPGRHAGQQVLEGVEVAAHLLRDAEDAA